MAISEIPDNVVEDALEKLTDVLDDTKYSQQASADAWGYIASQARDRQNCILQEIEDAAEVEEEDDDDDAD